MTSKAKAAPIELTKELLNELLTYDPETGKLYWKIRQPSGFISEKSTKIFNSNFAGKEAFTADDGYGYKTGSIFCKKYQAHRIIWMIVHGAFPVGVDHVDGNGCNNRISNLKEIKPWLTPAQRNAPRREMLNKVDLSALEFTKENLDRVLFYDGNSGTLYWKERGLEWFTSLNQASTWNKRYANKPALNAIRKNGYRGGCLFGRVAISHKIIWIMATGNRPDNIDHINGIRADNKLENLRSVTHAENMRNQKLRSDCKSGVPGVRFNDVARKWQASIGNNGTKEHLGYFDSKDKAVFARLAAEKRLGYHSNHGRP